MNLPYTSALKVTHSGGLCRLERILCLTVFTALFGVGSAQAIPTARAVNNFSQCQTPEFLDLLDINHQNGDFDELEAQLSLMELCTLPSQAQRLK